MELRWSGAAKRDLLDIWHWRGRDNPDLGDKVISRIEIACARLTRFPHLGPAFPRMSTDTRKLSVDGYLVFYRVDADCIWLMRVVDQRRLLDLIQVEED